MNRCMSRFVPIDQEGYSSGARQRLSDGRTFPHQLDFDRADIIDIQTEKMTGISISGVQDKISLRLHRGELEPVAEGGEYILKPVPSTQLSRLQQDVPANENLTMQLAEQVFDIETAANASIRLADGQLAYITRRFDRTREGEKIAQEDFCQLMGRTKATHGDHYKYDASYEQLGGALRTYCGAYLIEVDRLFRRIVFNYLVANGDAHLKNFSLYQSRGFGDYILTPAYDLICTKLHLPNESRLALNLLADGEYPTGVTTHGFVTGADLLEFADRLGVGTTRATETLDDLTGHRDEVATLIDRSFLSEEAKRLYSEILDDRRQALAIRD